MSNICCAAGASGHGDRAGDCSRGPGDDYGDDDDDHHDDDDAALHLPLGARERGERAGGSALRGAVRGAQLRLARGRAAGGRGEPRPVLHLLHRQLRPGLAGHRPPPRTRSILLLPAPRPAPGRAAGDAAAPPPAAGAPPAGRGAAAAGPPPPPALHQPRQAGEGAPGAREAA